MNIDILCEIAEYINWYDAIEMSQMSREYFNIKIKNIDKFNIKMLNDVRFKYVSRIENYEFGERVNNLSYFNNLKNMIIPTPRGKLQDLNYITLNTDSEITIKFKHKIKQKYKNTTTRGYYYPYKNDTTFDGRY